MPRQTRTVQNAAGDDVIIDVNDEATATDPMDATDAQAKEDEAFYSDRVKILIPAMMAHAGSIQAHSPDARRAFLDIITRSGDLPNYGVINPTPPRGEEGRRGAAVPPSAALPQGLQGMNAVAF